MLQPFALLGAAGTFLRTIGAPEKQALTSGQKKLFDFIVAEQRRTGLPPTTKEAKLALGLAHENSVVQFIRALEKKGYLRTLPGKARGIVVTGPAKEPQSAPRADGRPLFIDAPLHGDIQAGRPVDASPQTGENLRLDPAIFDLKKGSKLFALRARGRSMIGKGILDGDYIVLDAARSAKSGDVVAALLDGQSTLKTLVKDGRQTFLRAENPEFQDLKPQRELRVQGVMVGLFRGKR